MSFILIIFLSPLFIVVAVLIKISSKGSIFFKQKRIGKNKECFEILKFRTMRSNTPRDMPTHMLESPSAYITRVGKLLRKTSLDELPQLINILRGQMSFVGPRPALWNQHDLITEREQYGANDVLPGLTGWAQVNGRDELSIEDKARYDGQYISRKSIMFDLKVILMTIFSVLRSDGVKEGSSLSNQQESNLKL